MFYIPSKVHFIGIAGAGMAGLAGILHQKGYVVSGSDLIANAATQYLVNAGVSFSEGHDVRNLPEDSSNMIVVRSSAVSNSNIEYREALNRGIKCVLRGEMLAALAQLYKQPVAIAGSHGKTTVTALLVHILHEAGLNPGYMIGGKVNDMVFSADAGDSEIFITESDESDGTQVHLQPDILLVTNVEDDHSWTLGGKDVLMRNFAKIAENSRYVIYGSSNTTTALFKNHSNALCIDYTRKNKLREQFPCWGDFQLANALIALNGALKLGIPEDNIINALRTFPGVARRMSVRYNTDTVVILEDYAHHPTEVQAVLNTIRQQYPDYSLKVLFQPHRYARLEKYLDEFAETLKIADKIIITPVFAAWVEKGSVDSDILAQKTGFKAVYRENDSDIISEVLLGLGEKKEVIAVLGAGDIEHIIPILIERVKNVKGGYEYGA
jgi:UDP-N-acetylmuramate--alanine ligase